MDASRRVAVTIFRILPHPGSLQSATGIEHIEKTQHADAS